jgi:hypothetical protein
MGCAASQDAKPGRGARRKAGTKTDKGKGGKRNDSPRKESAVVPEPVLTVLRSDPARASASLEYSNSFQSPNRASHPFSELPTNSGNPLRGRTLAAAGAPAKGRQRIMSTATGSSTLSSITSDRSTLPQSRQSSDATLTHRADSNATKATVTSSAQKTSTRPPQSKRRSKVVNVRETPVSLPKHDEDGPKWKRHTDVKINCAVRYRVKEFQVMSSNKLARLQRWIDFSDHGTSPLGCLLNPQEYDEQHARDKRLKDLVEQGVPMYAQTSSVGETTSIERRRSAAHKPDSTGGVGWMKFKSRVALAIQKAKRRQSASWKLAGDLGIKEEEDDGNPEGVSPAEQKPSPEVERDTEPEFDAAKAADPEADFFDTDSADPTGSLVNFGETQSVTAVLDSNDPIIQFGGSSAVSRRLVPVP